MRKRELVAFLQLFYCNLVTVSVLWLFITVLWVGMQCAIVVFTGILTGFSSPEPLAQCELF